MRITFVFADGEIRIKENADTFKAALSTAMKNLEVLFEGDLLDYWDYKYLKTDLSTNSGWKHDHWVLEINKESRTAYKHNKRSGVYVPEMLYKSYLEWYFKMWTISGRIIEII